jgi:hypothetical protein
VDSAQWDSAQWLASYRERLDRVTANVRTAQESLRQAGGLATSPRGEVEVSVGPNGALTGLRLSPAARRLEVDELAQLILDTATSAQRAAGAQVVGIMTEFVGEGPALDLIREQIPEVPARAGGLADDEFPEIIR